MCTALWQCQLYLVYRPMHLPGSRLQSTRNAPRPNSAYIEMFELSLPEIPQGSGDCGAGTKKCYYPMSQKSYCTASSGRRQMRRRGGSRNFGKGGGKGTKPRTERQRRERWRGVWGSPADNFEKLDAISCNLAYIFGIRMASESKLGLCRTKKTVAATISKPTDIKK